MSHSNTSRLLLTFLLPVAAFAADSEFAVSDFNGRWDIQVHKTPANIAWWLEISGAGTPALKGSFVGFNDGSLHDLTDPNIENGTLHFSWERAQKHFDYEAKVVKGLLEGQMTTAGAEPLRFTGRRAPEINEHDDGTWVKGKPITLFNGKDLTNWTGLNSPKAEGWTVENGILKAAGRQGNGDDLITVQKFWNFELHAEYRLAEKSNGGIGLRGRYEVQIADDYGRPPGMHGTGALYTRILPPVNAAKPAGEWQTYDIRLVGREVTTILNGQKLYEKGVIDGLTGIAFSPDEGEPGALELQGDHGPVEFRNLILTPLMKKK